MTSATTPAGPGSVSGAPNLPDDPAMVELGETVTVQLDGGAPEQFLIVHPVEAPLNDTRISADYLIRQARCLTRAPRTY